MKPFKMILAVAFMGAGAAAAEPTCDAQKVVSDLSMPVIRRAADLAQTVVTLINKQMALQPKNTPNNEPVGKYMTKDQIEEFGELRGQILILGLSEFINSDYERDLLMTSDLLGVAENRYEGKPITADNAKYAELLNGLSGAIDDAKRDYRNTNGCNFYSALAPTISNLNSQLNDDAALTAQDEATLVAMAAKYRVATKNLPNITVSPDDSLVVSPIYNRMGQAIRSLRYARDLTRIEGLFQVSQIIYEIRVQAISTYGAAADKIDDMLDKRIAAMPDLEQQYFRVWGAINEKFPSEQAKFALEAAAATARMSDDKK